MQNITYYVAVIIGLIFFIKVLLHSIISSKKQWLIIYNDKVKAGEDSPTNLLRIRDILFCIGEIRRMIEIFGHAIIFGNLVIVVSLICQYFSFPSYSVDGLFYIFILRVGYLAYILNVFLQKDSLVS